MRRQLRVRLIGRKQIHYQPRLPPAELDTSRTWNTLSTIALLQTEYLPQHSAQIFGIRKSHAARAAERFFKERGVQVHFVDLKQKPMAPAEIRRFVERFGLRNLLDSESSAYKDAGLQYLKCSDQELLARIEREPAFLRLPLVRCANRISIGHDEEAWKAMLAG